MTEVDRFTNPDEWYGLRVWRGSGKSRLLKRLGRLKARPTTPSRRGYYLLRDYFGESFEKQGCLEVEYAYQRLLVIDWLTKFRSLGFFTEEEIRAHARLYAPPQDSILGHFWYGLLAREKPREIEDYIFRELRRRRESAKHFLIGPCWSYRCSQTD